MSASSLTPPSTAAPLTPVLDVVPTCEVAKVVQVAAEDTVTVPADKDHASATVSAPNRHPHQSDSTLPKPEPKPKPAQEQDPDPSATTATGDDVVVSAYRKIGIQHIQLAYETVGEKLLCWMCHPKSNSYTLFLLALTLLLDTAELGTSTCSLSYAFCPRVSPSLTQDGPVHTLQSVETSNLPHSSAGKYKRQCPLRCTTNIWFSSHTLLKFSSTQSSSPKQPGLNDEYGGLSPSICHRVLGPFRCRSRRGSWMRMQDRNDVLAPSVPTVRHRR